MAGEQRYSEEEAEQILRLATRGSGEGISRERLFQMADELGISPEEVLDAEKQVQSERNELRERQEFDRYQRKSFFSHLTSYLIVNAGLVAMNLVTDHRLTWAIWSILGWGIGIAFHVAETFLRNSDDYEQEFQKWRARKQEGLEAPSPSPKIIIGIHKGGSTSVARPPLHMSDLSERIERLVLADNLSKIEAIRRVREETGSSLKDAKDAVDAFDRANPGVIRR